MDLLLLLHMAMQHPLQSLPHLNDLIGDGFEVVHHRRVVDVLAVLAPVQQLVSQAGLRPLGLMRGRLLLRRGTCVMLLLLGITDLRSDLAVKQQRRSFQILAGRSADLLRG